MNTLLIICILLGVCSKALISKPHHIIDSINWWLIYIAVPALILNLIPKLEFKSSLWFTVLAMWLSFLVSALIFSYLGKLLHWEKTKIGVMIVLSSLANTGFMGFPIAASLYGEKGVQIAVIADQLGSFLILSTFGFIVAVIYSGKQISGQEIISRIFKFPPFIALMLASIIIVIGDLPQELDMALSKIGATMTPLVLFAIGLQLKLTIHKEDIPLVALSLLWKLGIIPALVLLFAIILKIDIFIAAVTVIESAMPTMITATLVVCSMGLNIRLASSIQGWSILFSFMTLPFWEYWVHYLLI